jgi:hypothetical protein
VHFDRSHGKSRSCSTYLVFITKTGDVIMIVTDVDHDYVTYQSFFVHMQHEGRSTMSETEFSELPRSQSNDEFQDSEGDQDKFKFHCSIVSIRLFSTSARSTSKFKVLSRSRSRRCFNVFYVY